MVGDREEPEEKMEKFDEFGQALEGYISLEQARVFAIHRARDNRDFYAVLPQPGSAQSSIQSIGGRGPMQRPGGERLCLFPRDDGPSERRHQRPYQYDQAQADGGGILEALSHEL